MHFSLDLVAARGINNLTTGNFDSRRPLSCIEMIQGLHRWIGCHFWMSWFSYCHKFDRTEQACHGILQES